jgi:hypothetical protein
MVSKDAVGTGVQARQLQKQRPTWKVSSWYTNPPVPEAKVEFTMVNLLGPSDVTEVGSYDGASLRTGEYKKILDSQ